MNENEVYKALCEKMAKALRELEDAAKQIYESKDKEVYAKRHDVLYIYEDIMDLTVGLCRAAESRKESEQK